MFSSLDFGLIPLCHRRNMLPGLMALYGVHSLQENRDELHASGLTNPTDAPLRHCERFRSEPPRFFSKSGPRYNAQETQNDAVKEEKMAT